MSIELLYKNRFTPTQSESQHQIASIVIPLTSEHLFQETFPRRKMKFEFEWIFFQLYEIIGK